MPDGTEYQSLYYKYEAVRVLWNRAALTPMHEDHPMLEEAQQLQETNYTIRIERLQRPALRLLIQDVKAWFTSWQLLRSMKWVHISAAVCVRLRTLILPMIQRHATSAPAGSLHRSLVQQPFIEQILLSLQPQYGNGLRVNPTCQELSPFITSCSDPPYVTSMQVMRRMDEAHAELPHSQQELAADHCGFLLEHFSRHGSDHCEHVCSQCGVNVDIDCIEHIYRMAQLIFCSEQCFEESLPA